MAITTYTELTDAVANWLERSDLTSRIPEFVTIAESRINRDLRIRMMETSTDITIDAQTEALPTGYVQAKRFYIDSSPDQVLSYVTPDKFWSSWGSQTAGKPEIFTIEGNNFVFGPTPDTTYTGKLLYYKTLTAVATTTSGNTLFSVHPEIYLYGALAEAYGYLMEDSEQLKYDGLYKRCVVEIQKEDIKDRHSGSPLIMRPDITIY